MYYTGSTCCHSRIGHRPRVALPSVNRTDATVSRKYYYVYKTSGNSKIFIDGIINRDCGVAVAFSRNGFSECIALENM